MACLVTQEQLDTYKTKALIAQQKRSKEAMEKKKKFYLSKLEEIDADELERGDTRNNGMRTYYLSRMSELEASAASTSIPIPIDGTTQSLPLLPPTPSITPSDPSEHSSACSPSPMSSPGVIHRAPTPHPELDRIGPVVGPGGQKPDEQRDVGINDTKMSTVIAVIESGQGVAGAVCGVADPGQPDAKSEGQPSIESEKVSFDPPIAIGPPITIVPRTPEGARRHRRHDSFNKEKATNRDPNTDEKEPMERIASPLADDKIRELIAAYRLIENDWQNWGVKKSQDLLTKNKEEFSILDSYRANLAILAARSAKDIIKRFK